MPAAAKTSVPEIRRLVAVQVALTAVFLLVVFVLLDGLDADAPSLWLIVVSLLVVVAGAVLAERSWLSVPALAATVPDPQDAALQAYVAHTVRKFAYCEGALLVCVLLAFISGDAGWLVVIAGLPGLAVLAFETWPSLRNVSLAEVSLDADGASSGLVEQFVAA